MLVENSCVASTDLAIIILGHPFCVLLCLPIKFLVKRWDEINLKVHLSFAICYIILFGIIGLDLSLLFIRPMNMAILPMQ